MIRSRNCDQSVGNEFAQKIINLHVEAGASLAGVIKAGTRIPWAGKVVSAHVYCATITDADDSVRVDLHKNGASILDATVDPVAADTLTSLAGAADEDLAAADKIQVVITTGVGDAFVGDVVLVIRPDLGTEV
jgi:hypothetical protein